MGKKKKRTTKRKNKGKKRAGAKKGAKKKPKTACKKKEQTCPLLKKKVIEIKWLQEAVWCSEKAKISGKTENYKNGETTEIKVIYKDDNSKVKQFDVTISGDSFQHEWEVLDILPKKKADKYVEEMKVDGKASDKTTPKPLNIHFIPQADEKRYTGGPSWCHFNLSAENYVMKIQENVEYVKGWAAQGVKLGTAVPARTAGLLTGSLAGYRWMKTVGVTKKYWNGSSWVNLPAGFNVRSNNTKLAGFYKNGTKFTSYYGLDWPENFTDWNINAPAKQQKIQKWSEKIKDTWKAKFDIKRKECKSSEKKCCRYKTEASCKFVQKNTYTRSKLIVADGYIRSNTSLFFINQRATTAPHEFGHYIGNLDEYAGATVDASLNEDGAVNGIDDDSIMGRNMTKVKKRHFRTVCKHFADMVKNKHGKTYSYEAVAPA